MPTNDNDLDIHGMMAEAGDPHGHAALLLVESLMHGLIQRSVLTVDESMEIIATAMEVQADVAEAADGAGRPMWRSHALLASMSESLQHDLDGRDPR